MTPDLDAVLASIDGALADDELPDAMRWHPDPGTVDDAGAPYAEDRYSPAPWSPLVEQSHFAHAPGCSIVHRYLGRAPSCQCGALDRHAATLTAAPVLALRPLRMPEAVRWALRAEQEREQYERALQGLREAFTPAAEALAGLVEAFRRVAADAGLWFSEVVEAIGKVSAATEHRPIPPPLRLRTEDPREYALALRQSRGTGPDRQVQHRPRPRHHT